MVKYDYTTCDKKTLVNIPELNDKMIELSNKIIEYKEIQIQHYKNLLNNNKTGELNLEWESNKTESN